MDGTDIMLQRLPRLQKLKTVRQVCEECPHLFTEGSLRWLIFRAAQNGFDACLVRVGRRVLIDTDRLREWLEGNRVTPGSRR